MGIKQLTVKDLKELCERAIEEGYGERLIVVADDNEGNGYHGLFYGLETFEIFNVEDIEGFVYDSTSTNPKEIISLG